MDLEFLKFLEPYGRYSWDSSNQNLDIDKSLTIVDLQADLRLLQLSRHTSEGRDYRSLPVFVLSDLRRKPKKKKQNNRFFSNGMFFSSGNVNTLERVYQSSSFEFYYTRLDKNHPFEIFFIEQMYFSMFRSQTFIRERKKNRNPLSGILLSGILKENFCLGK